MNADEDEKERQKIIVDKALGLYDVCAIKTLESFDSYWRNVCNGDIDFNQPIQHGCYAAFGSHQVSYSFQIQKQSFFLQSLLNNPYINIYEFFKKYKGEFEINFGLKNLYPELLEEILSLDEEKAIEIVDYIIERQQKVTKRVICFASREYHRNMLEENKFALMEKIIEMRVFGSFWHAKYERIDFCNSFIKAISTQKCLEAGRCTTLIQNNIVAGFFDRLLDYPSETSEEIINLKTKWFSAYSHGVISLKLMILRRIIYKTNTPENLEGRIEKMKIPKNYSRNFFDLPSYDHELERKIEERELSAKRKHK